ncbi:hypothetical protein GO684_02535 [Wolbachia endosymbiont of Litomosoides brasiliensis]|uniref:hypothetical protein n=1 Tax=Wolbachia endosymbiont of Litomosoides brasiliensis TaxID=1812117 RepID=UPI00158AF160|nr:hypothetical protein [Wolbachia endosymbiont of Litomosoides brasiliensis]NUY39550.1 hypothetical protein [Wolbachia endosymbiont of Litomosoides brasiliensis]
MWSLPIKSINKFYHLKMRSKEIIISDIALIPLFSINSALLEKVKQFIVIVQLMAFQQKLKNVNREIALYI